VFCRCKKDEVVDSTDRFAGYYTYVLTNSYLPDTIIGIMSIYKKFDNRVGVFTSIDNRERLFTVLDNLLIEDDNQYTGLPVYHDGTGLYFNESSQGVLKDSILTFKGSWFHTGFTTQTFKIVAYKMDK
jgi:hypothetical protein